MCSAAIWHSLYTENKAFTLFFLLLGIYTLFHKFISYRVVGEYQKIHDPWQRRLLGNPLKKIWAALDPAFMPSLTNRLLLYFQRRICEEEQHVEASFFLHNQRLTHQPTFRPTQSQRRNRKTDKGSRFERKTSTSLCPGVSVRSWNHFWPFWPWLQPVYSPQWQWFAQAHLRHPCQGLRYNLFILC